eukprot:TRINITY_DN227_c0_g1_i2.p1 TRINITY_DN227_c0_g1~~TRINITY_DN227_c0_g1_i2.p1  ORF type:complete len:511 (-),score=157.02 TRINITY_DN227_c0_g1_i2:642-2174(-)
MEPQDAGKASPYLIPEAPKGDVEGSGETVSSSTSSSSAPKTDKRKEEKKIETRPMDYVEHYLICVPGIGSRTEGGHFTPLPTLANYVRKNIDHVREKRYSFADIPYVIDFIDWSTSLRKREEIDRKIMRITPDGVPRYRSFVNDAAADVLFFMSDEFGPSIRRDVVKQLNSKFRKFKATYAEFSGKVTLLCHSLGGVIMYSLLSKQTDPDLDPEMRLEFDIENMITMGSPIGLFLLCTMRQFPADLFHFPTCRRFFNVFHPMDPIGYRVEPLLRDVYEHVPPAEIENYGRQKIHRIITTKYGEIRGMISRGIGRVFKRRADEQSDAEEESDTTNPYLQADADVDSTSKSSASGPPTLPASSKPNAFQKLLSKVSHFGRKKEEEGGSEKKPVKDDGTKAPGMGGDPEAGSGSDEDEDGDGSMMTIHRPPAPKEEIEAPKPRLDFVLQETTMQNINQYVFSVRAHKEYWLSKDLALFILERMLDIEWGSEETVEELEEEGACDDENPKHQTA